MTGTTEMDLTQTGAQQVSSMAKDHIGSGKLIDPARIWIVYVSPRTRATDTLKLLCAHASDTVEWEVKETEEVAEWDYGDYEGLTREEVRKSRETLGIDQEREWSVWRDGCPGGEYEQLYL